MIPFHHIPKYNNRCYYIPKGEMIPELNDRQLDRLSEFLSNLALLIVATLVLPNIFGGNKPQIGDLMSGVALTILLVSISMILVRKNNG